MSISPNTVVYLLQGIPLDNSYKNQLYFYDSAPQHEYFESKIKHTYTNLNYQRKDNVIMIPSHIDNLWDSNYIMYQNSDHSGKWYYAFITKKEYENDRCTRVYIETDVYQTWLDEVNLLSSFVVREHVADDTIGKHLIEEGLEHGEYIMHNYQASDMLGTMCIIMAVSDTTPITSEETTGNTYCNVPTGLAYFAFNNTPTGIDAMKSIIASYDSATKQDAIVMIFLVPRLVVGDITTEGTPIANFESQHFLFYYRDKYISDVDGYQPKNNKLHVYPYKYLYLTNSNGQHAVYHYEDFRKEEGERDIRFFVAGGITPNPTIMCSPINYRNNGICYEYGLTLDGYPQCSWVSDAYTAWLAQNSGSMAINLAGSAMAIGAGLATGNALAVGGGALSVANQMSQLYQHSRQPDQAKGQIGAVSYHITGNTLDYYFADMCIKGYYAKMIDDFFTMYGYKVNALKIPEQHSRQYWNYIQTIDVNITGNIPDDDMSKLKKMYDNGVTLWHSPSNVGNYSLNNSIRG